MIMPGNSRQVVIDAMEGLTVAPNIVASKVVNDLSDAGFRVVEHQELDGIIRGLLEVVAHYDNHRLDEMNPAVIKAKALLEILAA